MATEKMLEASEKQSTRDGGEVPNPRAWGEPGLKLEALVGNQGNQGEEKM